jgi:hypothetical protein
MMTMYSFNIAVIDILVLRISTHIGYLDINYSLRYFKQYEYPFIPGKQGFNPHQNLRPDGEIEHRVFFPKEFLGMGDGGDGSGGILLLSRAKWNRLLINTEFIGF